MNLQNRRQISFDSFLFFITGGLLFKRIIIKSYCTLTNEINDKSVNVQIIKRKVKIMKKENRATVEIPGQSSLGS